MSKMDLKVKINRNSFYTIQNHCFSKGVFWDFSGEVKKDYDNKIICLYYRKKSNTLQYGIYEDNFNLDSAKEVSIDDFIKKIV